jgi:phospholipase C
MNGATATAVAAGTATISAAVNGITGITGMTTLTVKAATQNSNVINHIIYMAQENRSFDQYFGTLNAYRLAQGLPANVDDLAAATNGANTGTITPDCTNMVACNPAFQTSTPLPSYHYATVCINDLSPFWNESHVDFNLQDPTSLTPKNNGFAWTAGGYSSSGGLDGGTDIQGLRAMGYYTDHELPYYYFMATQFATSDRFFAPAPTRTQANRMYLFAATSQGYVYPPTAQLSAPTIFDRLEAAGVSWKIYFSDYSSGSPDTYFTYFTSSGKLIPGHLVPITQYFTDLHNGTLPQVALIEGGYESTLDEHPSNNVQTGAHYVSTLINALMGSSSWNDSVFFLLYDEAGAGYDHVAPMLNVPSPDGIKPLALQPGDICSGTPDAPACDFTRTGFRIPLLVVSPFTKAHYVSHTPMDSTAILKFIETRFGLQSLTMRDAVQPPMDEFFDYAGVPNATPPSPPLQPGAVCDGITNTCSGTVGTLTPCDKSQLQ